MDISGVSIPTTADAYQAPSADAQVETAVKQASQADSSNNDSQSSASQDNGGQSAQNKAHDSHMGRIVDEQA